MRSFYFVAVLFVSFFLFTACGGEDCIGAECFEPADEISVTDDEEIADDATDETADEVVDEVVVDEESDDQNPDEDQGVTANCEKLLDIVGDWVRIDWTGYAFTLTVTPRETDCKVSVKWTEGFNVTQEWFGLELPLTIWSEHSYCYMTLKKAGENLVREETQENGDFIGDMTFKKIQ